MQSVNSNKQYSYATVAAIKLAQIPSQPWTKVSYRNWKNGALIVVKAE